ncbi:MAG: hypothetical protein JST26_00715 [Bacteroidetes bacterium]|nr:hypothetical protein [Bacteroidota bacterium]
MLFGSLKAWSQPKNEDDLKKEALKAFEEEDYAKAYKYYAQLVSLYPKDPEFNYHLGVCMLYTEPDKKKPFSYLQIATNNPKDAPKDAKFYLAKAYHYNYRFDDALKLYNEYKQTAGAANVKKLQVDREIDNCKNGKRLLSNLSDLVIIEKKQLNESDYFRAYNLSDIGGKLLVKPDDFKSGQDKKKKEKSVIYLPNNAQRVYYSSYGENGSNGRDIYFVNRLPNGSWSKPQAMPATINTEYDEDYPFLHPNGHTLYFASKGHNSMGGYDIFKSTFDDQTQTWSKPVNLDFPINSPDDDILFVTDSLEKTAYFSTGRYSPYGKLDVLKISTERRPMDIAVLKGTVVKENVNQSVKSKITVKNIANGEIVGTYQAQDNGDYYMELPNGGKFIFTVETPGLPTQSDGVQMPIAYSLKPYKQVISYENKVLKIINYFDGQISDDNYSMYLDLIEKKARLEVNENEPYNNNLLNNNGNQGDPKNNLNAVNTNNPSVVNENTGNPPGSTTNPKNVSNEDLLNIAREDQKEATEEAAKLKQEAQDAMGLATQKNQEATEKQKLADEALTAANSITDVAKKNEELSKANDLKDEAKIAKDVANTALNLAKKLEVDADMQQKEADLSAQYVKELEAVTKNKNNKDALNKLEQLQKQLDDLSKQKNQSDELFSSLKAETELKQNELKKEEQKNDLITNDINTLKTEVKDLQNDLANEKDAGLKENINAQIRELNTDIESKNKEIASNNQKIDQLKNELEGVTKELEIAAKILNEKPDNLASNTNTPGENAFEGAVDTKTATTNTPVTNETTPGNYNDLAKKYESITAANTSNETSSDPGELIKQNDALTNYNKDIEALIAKDKATLSKSKNADEKKNLNNDIKQLEKQKSSNTTLIAANNTKIKQLENAIASNTASAVSSESTSPVSTNTLEPTATTNTTAIANNTLTSNPTETTTINTGTNDVTTLLSEAETLNNQAADIRKQAGSKTGDEQISLIKQATDLEKQAITKKLQANEISVQKNNSQFETNNQNIEALLKLNGSKTNDDISQANMLVTEAEINFKQARDIHKEADNYPTDASKLGGYSNAEDKEQEALLKQKKAIELLMKNNPGYTLIQNTSQPANTTDINNEQVKIATEQSNTYLAQSKKNQDEIKQKDRLIASDPAFNTNQEAKTLKTKSDNLNKEATALVSKANNTGNPLEKAKLLAEANQKEQEALNTLNEAGNILSKGNNPVAVNPGNNNGGNNGGNNNDPGNTNAARTNTTTNTNSNPENTAGTNTLSANTNTLSTATESLSSNNPGETNASANTGTSHADEANTLKTTLNDPNEQALTGFSNYVNTEAIQLKDQAYEKINEALSEDKTLSGQLDQVAATTGTISPGASQIESLTTDAESLNKQAYTLRKEASAKTGDEKDKLIAQAKDLEAKAIAKKLEASKIQRDVNVSGLESNAKALEELAQLTKTKNVAEKSSIEKLINEANNAMKQARNLREEANSYSTDAAKLGGYNNAEEKEAEALAKQQKAIGLYKKYAPDYVVNQPVTSDGFEDIKSSVDYNTQAHVNGLMLLTQANEKEYRSRFLSLPVNLSVDQQALKTKAQASYKQSQNLTAQANQAKDLAKKKTLLTEASKSGQEAINFLNQISGGSPLAVNTATETGNPVNTSGNNDGGTGNNPNNTGNNNGGNNSGGNNSNNPLVNNGGNNANNGENNTGNTNGNNGNNPVNNGGNDTNAGTNPVTNNGGNTNGGNTNAGNPNRTGNTSPANNNNPGNTSNEPLVTLKTKGIEIKNNSAYSSSKPIPIDEKIQDGLVFKVQVGAFKNPLPNDQFKGLSPVVGQTTPSGYIRYMAGNFDEFTDANAVKNDLRRLGYSDAFVVAYYNGQRITINEAIGKLKESGKTVDVAATNTSAGITENSNVPRSNFPVNPGTAAVANTTDSQPAEITKELEQTNGLLYTIQIGVFSKQATRSQLHFLKPIYTEKLPSGLYRYTAGIYNQSSRLLDDKRRVVDLGIKDAFVSVYYNAKRIAYADAQKIQSENNNLKLETENPIVFPDGGNTTTVTSPANTNTSTPVVSNTTTPVTNNTPTVTPFSNGVTKAPEPTAENGVKVGDEGISFKVQIGAYKNQVPNDVASKFLNIKTWPVESKAINGLFIYTIGNFVDAKFAKTLKEEAVSLGITDAFVTVYKDGKKLYGAEASQYLNR